MSEAIKLPLTGKYVILTVRALDNENQPIAFPQNTEIIWNVDQENQSHILISAPVSDSNHIRRVEASDNAEEVTVDITCQVRFTDPLTDQPKTITKTIQVQLENKVPESLVIEHEINDK